MKRPTVTREMVLAAAHKIGGVIGDEWAETIADNYRQHMDGYQLARAIDSCGDLSMQDVEELDRIPSLVDQSLGAAEKQWVAENNITPKLEIGTAVSKGVIAGVCEYSAARYLVKEHGCTTKGRYLLMKFEDAERSVINGIGDDLRGEALDAAIDAREALQIQPQTKGD